MRQVVVDPWLEVKLMTGLRRYYPARGEEGRGVMSLLVNTVVHLIETLFSRLKLTTKSISWLKVGWVVTDRAIEEKMMELEINTFNNIND